MNSRQLEYVLAIAQTGSISKASSVLHISQPSLSQFIQRLELELHTTLFDRSASPLKLTYAGEVYVHMARSCLLLEREMQAKLREADSVNCGKIAIGITPYRTTYLLPKVLKSFRDSFPSVEVTVRETSNAKMEKLLIDGDVDLAITIMPMQNEHLIHEILFEEEIVLTVPASGFEKETNNYTVPTWPGVLSLERFSNAPFVSLTKGQNVRQVMEKACLEAGFSANSILSCQNIESVRSLVAAGLGVSMLPLNDFISENDSKNLLFYRVHSNYPRRQVAISYRKNHFLTAAMKAFIKELKHAV